MADNLRSYGFRWSTALSGRPMPSPFEAFVATAQSFDVTGGASNVGLGAGDPIYPLASGGVTLCPGAETTALSPMGVVVGVAPYWNGSEMINGKLLPSDTAWGTNLERQSKVFWVPFDAGVWEIDCDDAATATTKAAYQLLVNLNAPYRLNGGIGGVASDRAYPMLDISAAATTNTFTLRIMAISKTVKNQDFSGNYVKLAVRANLAELPSFALVGAPTLNATTGV